MPPRPLFFASALGGPSYAMCEPVSQSWGIQVSNLLHSTIPRNNGMARRIRPPSLPLSETFA